MAMSHDGVLETPWDAVGHMKVSKGSVLSLAVLEIISSLWTYSHTMTDNSAWWLPWKRCSSLRRCGHLNALSSLSWGGKKSFFTKKDFNLQANFFCLSFSHQPLLCFQTWDQPYHDHEKLKWRAEIHGPPWSSLLMCCLCLGCTQRLS